MKRLVPLAAATAIFFLSAAAFAQDKPVKIAVIDIQRAIAQSNDGQAAAKQITERFQPKRNELEKMQNEIASLQDQLKNQEKTLSDDARTKLMRSIDDKTRAYNRSNEDATQEWQQAEQDAINEIGRKMMAIVAEHAKKNGFGIVLDVSSPQTPVLYADPSTEITDEIINQYNLASAKAAPAGQSSTSSTAAPAAAPATSAPKPAASSSPTPASPPAAQQKQQ